MQIDLSVLEIYLLAPRHAIDYKNKEKKILRKFWSQLDTIFDELNHLLSLFIFIYF